MSKIITVGFPGYESVEPENLIVFNNEYLNCLPSLKTYIEKNKNKFVQLPFTRIGQNGNSEYKILEGWIRSSVEDDIFILNTNKDFNSEYEKEEGHDLKIRFENVLGLVMLPVEEPNMYPFAIPSSELHSSYVDVALPKIRTELKKWIGVDHIAKLHFRYNTKHPNFRLGDYTVECKIIKVNQSNIKYEHYRTFTQLPGIETYDYVDERKGIENDRFIAPDRYLREVCILPCN